ncbi:MAG: hypothetical protein AAGJ18_27410 [Bacteroidota bacterium]
MKLLQKLPLEDQTAIVLLVEDKGSNIRYFKEFSKGKLVTSWSLLGAKLFSDDNPNLSFIENALHEKGYLFKRCQVTVNNELWKRKNNR